MDVVILTTESLGVKTARDYAADYFDYNGYGRGEAHDGVMLMLSMADRDWYILTTGRGIEAITDYGIDTISGDILPYFSGGDYASGFTRFLHDIDVFLKQYQSGRPYDVDNRVQLRSPFERATGIAVYLAIAAAVIAVIVLLVMILGMKTARPQYNASEYVKDGSLNITAKRQFHSAADLVIRHAKRLIGRSYDYLRREIKQAQPGGLERRFLDEFRERIERGNTGDTLIRVGIDNQQFYTPQQIAEILLRKVREDAEPQVRQLLGTQIENAVITVPAGFDDAPLRATLWAGEQVFGPRQCPAHSRTAGRRHRQRRTEEDQETIMVVDMGAGTTDIVVGNRDPHRLGLQLGAHHPELRRRARRLGHGLPHPRTPAAHGHEGAAPPRHLPAPRLAHARAA